MKAASIHFVLVTLALTAVLTTGCTSLHRLPDADGAAAVIAVGRGQARTVELSQPLDQTATFYPSLFPALKAGGDAPTGSEWLPLSVGLRIFPGGSPFILGKGTASSPYFTTGEHTGTHMDAPCHFRAMGRDIDRTPPADLARPMVVVDVREAAEANATLGVGVDTFQNWEKANGRIPNGAIVMLMTGKSKKAGDIDTNHPGFTAEAAEWLRSERDIGGVGTDSLSPDVSGNLNFPVHQRLLADECIILENVVNLDRMPARSGFVLIGALPIKEGSGSPVRLVGITGATANGNAECLSLSHRLDRSMPTIPGRDERFNDLDIPVLDDINPFEVKVQLLPGSLPIDRETTAKPIYHGYHNGYFRMSCTAGTHVWFPAASAAGGLTAEAYPIDKLILPALVADLRKVPDGTTLQMADLMNYLPSRDLAGRALVLSTGRDSEGFTKERLHPGLSADAAAALMQAGVRGILTDAASIEAGTTAIGPATAAVHAAGGFVVGFLDDPKRLAATGATLAILPLPIAGAVASPARVLAYQH